MPHRFLAASIGLVYLWFGALKFFPDFSPAEGIAAQTIDALFLGLFPASVSLLLLAIWECAIGVLLLAGIWRKPALIAAFVHMVFTFAPLFLFPETSFTRAPYAFTLLGQYILKNLVILGALWVLYREWTPSRGATVAEGRN